MDYCLTGVIKCLGQFFNFLYFLSTYYVNVVEHLSICLEG